MPDDPNRSGAGPPDLGLAEEWERTLEERSTKERVYEAVTGLTDPATVSTIAERADCSPNGARSNLEWLAELGIVDVVSSDPTMYRRNEAYFEFLRAHRLAEAHDPEELGSLIEDYVARDAELAEQFGVESPDGVEPMAIETGEDFETIADRVSEWRTVRRRLRDLRRARLLADRNDRSGTVPV